MRSVVDYRVFSELGMYWLVLPPKVTPYRGFLLVIPAQTGIQ
jgi:hypothetical protein